MRLENHLLAGNENPSLMRGGTQVRVVAKGTDPERVMEMVSRKSFTGGKIDG